MNGKHEVQMRRRRSREEVERLAIEFEASGLRLMEFCRKHGLPPSTLQRHLKRQRLAHIQAKQDNRLVAGGIGWNEWQQGWTRCKRFASGAIQRPEDRGVAGFRFTHLRTTTQRLGEEQSSKIDQVPFAEESIEPTMLGFCGTACHDAMKALATY